MANYAILKADIAQYIKENHENDITGQLLQQHLLAMVNSFGVGYQYIGTATPGTNPGTPDQNVFYLASTAGTYTNFGGLVLTDGEIAILKYNGTWSKDSTGAASLELVNWLGQEIGIIPLSFAQGNVNANTGLPNPGVTIRVRLAYILNNTQGKIVVKTIAPFQIYAYASYDSPSYDSFIEITDVTSYTHTFETGKYIIPIFRKTDNSDFTPADLLPNVTIERTDSILNRLDSAEDDIATLETSVEQNTNDIVANKSSISLLDQQIEQIPLNFVNGGINGNTGLPVATTSRARLDYFLNNTQGQIVVKATPPYQVYAYAVYNAPSFDSFVEVIGLQAYTYTFETGKYIIPIFRKTDNSDFTPADLLPNVTIERVDALFGQIGGLNDMVIGIGDVPYNGLEKISFGINKDDFKCTKTLILSQTATQAGLNKYQQGLEIINGKILSFCDNSDADYLGYILDLTSLAQIGYIDVTNIGDCHCNNVQFTDVYYDTTDNYPLIIISQFLARGAYANNKAYVVRLQESGNNLIGTIVKTITPSESVVGSPYGASYAYNNTTKELIVYTNTFYFGTVEDETNKTNIFVYDFPDLINGGDIILGEPKRHFYLPYHILQGATIKNGMLIWPVQKVQYFNGVPVSLPWPQNVLEFVDLSNGVVKAFVPIERTLEPEGCCSYDNAIYVAYHKGDATGTQEALRIERFDFN